MRIGLIAEKSLSNVLYFGVSASGLQGYTVCSSCANTTSSLYTFRSTYWAKDKTQCFVVESVRLSVKGKLRTFFLSYRSDAGMLSPTCSSSSSQATNWSKSTEVSSSRWSASWSLCLPLIVISTKVSFLMISFYHHALTDCLRLSRSAMCIVILSSQWILSSYLSRQFARASSPW